MRTATEYAREAAALEARLASALTTVGALTGEVVELKDRIARRDETIAELVAEVEHLLREIATAEAHQDMVSEVLA